MERNGTASGYRNSAEKIIISGGGTGGHIFPALSIAGALKELRPDCDILFVGAEGKMEMQKVPQAGYPIKGLPVAGLSRKFSLSNFALPGKVLRSLNMADRIISAFKPDVVIGVGGYASAPTLWKASAMGIPCLIQEQNSFAGLTNRILGRRADVICTAYEGMERFFPSDKIILTGNPIRKGIRPPDAEDRKEAVRYFGLNPERKTVLVIGGSLGCGTFNRIMRSITGEAGTDIDYQILWQNGEAGHSRSEEFFSGLPHAAVRDGFRRYGHIINTDFITRMDLAFAAADLIISRAGAGTISELCAAGKPTIFVPSPNVTEDHQTHNAMALVKNRAALMVSDTRADIELRGLMEESLHNDRLLAELRTNILKLSKPDAALRIAEKVFELTDWK